MHCALGPLPLLPTFLLRSRRSTRSIYSLIANRNSAYHTRARAFTHACRVYVCMMRGCIWVRCMLRVCVCVCRCVLCMCVYTGRKDRSKYRSWITRSDDPAIRAQSAASAPSSSSSTVSSSSIPSSPPTPFPLRSAPFASGPRYDESGQLDHFNG